ncbi:hypothetical protein P9749_02860, partial [Geobacillus stearothermophilus]|nr:hypothetical protein [Geobacillus stearothermophilus]
FYRASLGGPDERREQKFATLVGDHFGMSPTNILLTPTTSTTKQDSIEKDTKLEKSQKTEEDSQAKNTSSSTLIRILTVSLGIILIVGLISILKKKG